MAAHLRKELKDLKTNPPEGFNVELVDGNMFKWEVGIFGAPGTIYEGAYFMAILDFPKDYPFSPFEMTFTSPMWHPNIYENGKVCISILHPPGHDPMNQLERADEKWNPAFCVSNVMVSVVSMLIEPETRSPANIAASVMYQKQRKEFDEKVKKLVKLSQDAAIAAKIDIPKNIQEYTERTVKARERNRCLDHLTANDDYGFDSSSSDYDSDEDCTDEESLSD